MRHEKALDFKRLNVEAVLATTKKIKLDRAYRDRQNLFYIEGVHNIIFRRTENYI